MQLRWRVKLVAEQPSGVTTETELACIERNEQISLAELATGCGFFKAGECGQKPLLS